MNSCKAQEARHFSNSLQKNRCELCDVNCNSPFLLQQHKMGRKHMQNCKNESMAYATGNAALVQRNVHITLESKIQKTLEEVAKKEPIVGLDYVEEHVFDDLTNYRCALCSISVMPQCITSHLLGWKHRLKHMQVKDLAQWAEVMEMNPTCGSRSTSRMRKYAQDVSQLVNGAYRIPKLKVVRHAGPFSQGKMKQPRRQKPAPAPVQNHIPTVISTNQAATKSRKEIELDERERMLNEKERMLQEGEERQIQEGIEMRLQERRLLQHASEQRKNEGGTKTQESLVDFICRNEKEQVVSEEGSGDAESLSEHFVLQSLLRDAKERNAHQEIALILKLAATDRKILYLLMLQRRRFRASLKKLEESIGDRPLSSSESLIKARLETALDKMKADGRQILSTVLWPEDEATRLDSTVDLSHLASLLKERRREKAETSSLKQSSTASYHERGKRSPLLQTPFDTRDETHASSSKTHSYDHRDTRETPHTTKLRYPYDMRNDPYDLKSASYDRRDSGHFSESREYERDRRRTPDDYERYHSRSWSPTSRNDDRASRDRRDDDRVSRDRRDDDRSSRERGFYRAQTEMERKEEAKRKMMEDKIFESLCKGSLAPIAKAFSNNPTLQAALKKWEGSNRKRKDESSSRDSSPKAEQLHAKEPKPMTSDDTRACVTRDYETSRRDDRDYHDYHHAEPPRNDSRGTSHDGIDHYARGHDAYHDEPDPSGDKREYRHAEPPRNDSRSTDHDETEDYVDDHEDYHDDPGPSGLQTSFRDDYHAEPHNSKVDFTRDDDEAYHDEPGPNGLQRSRRDGHHARPRKSDVDFTRDDYDDEKFFHEEDFSHEQVDRGSQPSSSRASETRTNRRDAPAPDTAKQAASKKPLLPNPKPSPRREGNPPLLQRPPGPQRSSAPPGKVSLLASPQRPLARRPLLKTAPAGLLSPPLLATPRPRMPNPAIKSAARVQGPRPRQPLLPRPAASPRPLRPPRPGMVAKRKGPFLRGAGPPVPAKKPLLQRPPFWSAHRM